MARIGLILAAWLLLLTAEHLAVGLGYRELFVGTWEMGAARTFVSPIALTVFLPLAVLAYLVLELCRRSVIERQAQLACAGFGASAAAAVAIGVSSGRHMQSLVVRVPFVAVLAVLGFLFAYAACPRLVIYGAKRPRTLAVLGAAFAALFWMADAFILPRLYPAFHLALFGLTLTSAALVARPFWSRKRLGIIVLGLAIVSTLLTPWAARRLSTVDNLRIVLLDHAPLAGRVVLLAAALAPPPEDPPEQLGIGGSGASAGWTSAKMGEVPRALDWSGRDIVLLSIDALRADHVGAYGYERPTTPNIDRLAAEGTLFEWAYCPTPHTSYSITSMMTGKYMRPLLLVGLGEDSETWALLLRQYGHLTAAFYPPAVFFIDAPRFVGFEKSGLDFEYRRVEFSSADDRAEQVGRYLEREAHQAARPLFLWVHLFEPHEPYVMHPEHPFGPPEAQADRDRYDSEIAAADAGVGKILARVREKRPNAIVMVTADHGEEFGEHGGRYHGTTVYEEQVRVPLIVAGAGPARRVSTVVQTVDLLPTTLSALGIPRPARLRGRDLGPMIAGTPLPTGEGGTADPGMAFAETDDYTLVAKGAERLVCARKAGACALYEPKSDPREERELGAERPEALKALRHVTSAIAREHGRLERGDAQSWPDALRRGSQGDADAAEDVAALLDDVRLDVRRKAAEVLFELHATTTIAALHRALAKAEDLEIQRGCALALVRLGEPASRVAEEALRQGEWKRRAALAFAERGDPRGGPELVSWWSESTSEKGVSLELERGKELLGALGKLRDRTAVTPLVRSLVDVRLRPFIADALAAIGDPSARPALLAALANERYVPTRPHLARALLTLGARDELRGPLARFAGIPEPMWEAIRVAYEAKILDPAHGGWASSTPRPEVSVALTPLLRSPAAGPQGAAGAAGAAGPQGAAGAVPMRLVVLLEKAGDPLQGAVGGIPLAGQALAEGPVRVFELGPLSGLPTAGPRVEVALASPGGVRALWLLARTEEIEPPPPEPWDAGSVDPTLPGQ